MHPTNAIVNENGWRRSSSRVVGSCRGGRSTCVAARPEANAGSGGICGSRSDTSQRKARACYAGKRFHSQAQRYEIDESARVPMRDGNVLSAIVVRPRRLVGPQPAVLELTIYASEQNRTTALEAAAQGFVGIVATSRGARERRSGGPVRARG